MPTVVLKHSFALPVLQYRRQSLPHAPTSLMLLQVWKDFTISVKARVKNCADQAQRFLTSGQEVMFNQAKLLW